MNQGNKSCGYLIAEFNSFNCSASTDVDLITVFDKWPNLVFYWRFYCGLNVDNEILFSIIE